MSETSCEEETLPHIEKDTGLVANGVLYAVPMKSNANSPMVVLTSNREAAYNESLDVQELYPGDDVNSVCSSMLGVGEDTIALKYLSQEAPKGSHLHKNLRARETANPFDYPVGVNNSYYYSTITDDDTFKDVKGYYNSQKPEEYRLNCVVVAPLLEELEYTSISHIDYASLAKRVKQSKNVNLAIPSSRNNTHYGNYTDSFTGVNKFLVDFFGLNESDYIENRKYYQDGEESFEEKLSISALYDKHVVNDNEFYVEGSSYCVEFAEKNNGLSKYYELNIHYDPKKTKKKTSYLRGKTKVRAKREDKKVRTEEDVFNTFYYVFTGPSINFLQAYNDVCYKSWRNDDPLDARGFRFIFCSIDKSIFIHETYIKKSHSAKEKAIMFKSLEEVDYPEVLKLRKLDSMDCTNAKQYYETVLQVLEMYDYKESYLKGFKGFTPNKESWLYGFAKDYWSLLEKPEELIKPKKGRYDSDKKKGKTLYEVYKEIFDKEKEEQCTL